MLLELEWWANLPETEQQAISYFCYEEELNNPTINEIYFMCAWDVANFTNKMKVINATNREIEKAGFRYI